MELMGASLIFFRTYLKMKKKKRQNIFTQIHSRKSYKA